MKQFFTFGSDHVRDGQSLLGQYVLVEADDKEMCRQLMFGAFGREWSFQYDIEELPAMEEKYKVKCYGTIVWKKEQV